jgi:periplasmic protein CpxP/Spy
MALHTSCKPKPTAASAPTAEATPATAAQTTPASTPTLPPLESQAPAPAMPPQGNNGGNRPGGGGNFQQRAEERLQQMKTDVGLTDEQVQKVRSIYEENFGALRSTMGDPSMSREERRAAFEKARASASTAVEAILTPEQKPKWEDFKKKMEQRRGQRPGGGNQ